MVQSARVLLEHGAEANSLCNKYQFGSEDGISSKFCWNETPLAKAYEVLESRKKCILSDRHTSRNGYEHFNKKKMAMIAVKEYGGHKGPKEKEIVLVEPFQK
jgi:hypothetical protein